MEKLKKVLDRIISRISGLKIMYKLLLVYIIIGIFPLTLLSIYMTYTTDSIIMDQHKSQVTAENKRVRNILFNTVYLATNISDTIVFDRELNKLLKKSYDTEDEVYKAYRNYETIDSIKKNYTEISSIKIFVTNKTLFTNGPFVRVDDQIEASTWYQKVKDSSGKLMWVYDNTIDSASSLQLIRKLSIPKSKDYAVISINLSTNYLRFIINNNMINSIISFGNKTSFYSNNYFEIGCPLTGLYQAVKMNVNQPFKSIYMGTDTLAYASTLNAPKSKSVFQITTFDTLAYSHKRQSNFNNIRIIVINLLVSLFMIIGFSVVFNKSILILRREMNKIANGNLNIIENFKSNDELGELFKDMQKTIHSIQQLNSRIYEEKLLRQKLLNYQQQMEFKLLTNQINPHFLYNTLETIRMQLSINKEYEAAHIVKQLGKFMRHNIKADSTPVLLLSELEYIRIYMNIQHFRFGDRVNLEITAEKDIDIADYKILPLLIQPIVENAFVHGLESKKTGGTVTIRISTEEDSLIISVADNGLGMSEDTLGDLINSINDSHNKPKNHVGMHNVQQRIKLFYGENYGMRVESVEKQFTAVTMRLPLKVDENALVRNEGFYHEIYNC